MAEKQSEIERFWQFYLTRLPAGAPRLPQPGAWSFGDSPALADELLDLVLQGVKTATCGALWAFEADGEAIPWPGDLSIVLDGAGRPRCVVETVEVTIKRYDEVDAAFAAEEGEGGRSLAYWRAAHRRFFRRTLPAIGREFSEAMPLLGERFRVVYSQQEPS